MSDSEGLKPCPFCGGEAELVKEHFFGGDYYAGRCRSCAATSTFESTKEEAMTEWNRRVCVSSKPETLDTNSVAVKKLDTKGACVSQNGETLDTNGSCTKKSYSCEEIETMRKKLEYYEADAGGASVADLLAENRRLRAGLPSHLDSSPKPTYEELEKMVKPLEWKGNSPITADFGAARFELWATPATFFELWLSFGFDRDIFIADGEMAECKHAAQKWLVDIVADALGVERSGE